MLHNKACEYWKLGHDKGISRARWSNEMQTKMLGPDLKAT